MILMKKPTLHILLFFAFLITGFSVKAHHTSPVTADSTLINFYRPAQGMMSGGQGLTVEIFIDGKKITDAGNGALIHFTTYKEGVVEIKIQKSGYGSVMGVPVISKFSLVRGKALNILFEGTGSMGQVSMKELDEAKAAKLEKNTKDFPGIIYINEKDVK